MKFKSTGAFLLRYKAQFGQDPLPQIFKLAEVINEEGEITDINALDLEFFFNLIWVLAKTADPSIPPPMEWLDTFDEFPLADILPELMDMISSSLQSTVENKKIEPDEDKAPFELTTELVMLKAFERGLTLRDFEIMTFGMIIDYIITYNNVIPE